MPSTAQIRSLGIDLGVPNTALTLLQTTVPVHRIQVLKASMLFNPLSNLTDNPVRKKRKRKGKVIKVEDHAAFPEQLEHFLGEAGIVVSEGLPDLVTAERFLGRGFTAGGALAESISMMNMGFVSLARRYRCRFRLCTSAIWKNQLRRTLDRENADFSLETLYATAHSMGITSHILDSFLIALFGTGDPLCYTALLKEKTRLTLLNQLACAEGF